MKKILVIVTLIVLTLAIGSCISKQQKGDTDSVANLASNQQNLANQENQVQVENLPPPKIDTSYVPVTDPNVVPKDLLAKYSFDNKQGEKKEEIQKEEIPPQKIKELPKHTKKEVKKVEIAKVKETPKESNPYSVEGYKRKSINVGEKITLDMTYFGVSAGKLTMEVMPFKYLDGRKVYLFRGTAKSSKVFSLFYRADDWVESYVDYENFYTYKIVVKCDETLNQKDEIEIFDMQSGKSHFWSRNQHKKKGLILKDSVQEFTRFAQDSFSALYYARNFELKVGDVIKFPIVSQGTSWDTTVKVLRKEKINTKLGQMNTIVIQPETHFKGVLTKRGDVFIWLSDDDKKRVVKVSAKIKIGEIVGYVDSIEKGSQEEY